MNTAECTLHPKTNHACPSRFSAASDTNPIPMYRWMQWAVTQYPNIKDCLTNVQHLVAGQLLDSFQNQIMAFSCSANTLLSRIQVTSGCTWRPAAVAERAITEDVRTLTQAVEQGNQTLSTRLAKEFVQSLSERLPYIRSEPDNSCPSHSPSAYKPSCEYTLKDQCMTLQIWLKALEALSAGEQPEYNSKDVQALEMHSSWRSSKNPDLMEFWKDLSTKLLTVYSEPYYDHIYTI